MFRAEKRALRCLKVRETPCTSLMRRTNTARRLPPLAQASSYYASSYLGMEIIPEPNAEGNQMAAEEGVIIGRDADVDDVAAEFIHAIAQHRHWSREMKDACTCVTDGRWRRVQCIELAKLQSHLDQSGRKSTMDRDARTAT